MEVKIERQASRLTITVSGEPAVLVSLSQAAAEQLQRALGYIVPEPACTLIAIDVPEPERG